MNDFQGFDFELDVQMSVWIFCYGV